MTFLVESSKLDSLGLLRIIATSLSLFQIAEIVSGSIQGFETALNLSFLLGQSVSITSHKLKI